MEVPCVFLSLAFACSTCHHPCPLRLFDASGTLPGYCREVMGGEHLGFRFVSFFCAQPLRVQSELRGQLKGFASAEKKVGTSRGVIRRSPCGMPERSLSWSDFRLLSRSRSRSLVDVLVHVEFRKQSSVVQVAKRLYSLEDSCRAKADVGAC